MMLDIARSITRNTTVMMGSQLVTWVSSFVLMMFLPRYLGSEDYGRLYLAISIAMIFEVLINYGGQYHITKETSRNRHHAPDILVNSILLRAVLWIVSLAAMIVFSVLAGYPSSVRDLIIILGISKLWEGASWVMRWTFQGFERMQYPCMGAMLERLLLTAAGVAALLLGANSGTIAMVMAACALVNCLFLLASIRKIIPHVPRIRPGTMKTLMREAVPYFLWSAFAVMYYRIDAVMLSLMTPESVVGWYGAAYRFFDILMFLPSIYTTALFPIISRLSNNDANARTKTTQRSLEFLVVAGVPIAILVFTFSRSIIQFFFGLEDFAQSAVLLQVFSLGMVLVYVDFVLGATVLAEDKQRQWSLVAALAIPLNIALNYLMIPYFQQTTGNGGIGAATATILTEGFILVSALALLSRTRLYMPRPQILLKCSVAGTLMGLFLFIVHADNSLWIIAASLALVVYVVSLAAMKPLAPEEERVVRSLFSAQSLRQMLTERQGGR